MNRLFDPTCVTMRMATIKFTSFQSGWCLVLWACSETAEVWVRVIPKLKVYKEKFTKKISEVKFSTLV